MNAASTTYIVSGMSCEHCRRSVIEEVSALPGVASADVDLVSGRLAVAGDATFADVAKAVRAAGYEVTE